MTVAAISIRKFKVSIFYLIPFAPLPIIYMYIHNFSIYKCHKNKEKLWKIE